MLTSRIPASVSFGVKSGVTGNSGPPEVQDRLLPYNTGMANHPDVTIIGGGIIGLTAAYFLAKCGRQVEVIDRQEFGREASWAGAGILPPGNPQRARTPADILRAESVSRFARFTAELRELSGHDTGYVRCGGLEFLEANEASSVDIWRNEEIRYGLFNPESGIQIPDDTSAYYLPDFAQVRNPWYLRALIAACSQVGVTMRPNTPYTPADVHANHPHILASGAWSAEFLRTFQVALPVRPVRGQIVLFRCSKLPFTRILMLGKRYLVPRPDGRILVGSTEEPEAGFVKANTPEGVDDLKQFAFGLCPALRTAEIEATWAGLRPGSPDGLPYIGAVNGVKNLYAAVGHSRAGVQLSIGTAMLIRELLVGLPSGIPMAPFRLERDPDLNTRPAFRS
jgi:glycine oxidase